MKPQAEQNPRTAEEHYQRGVAMMNLGRWDEARESLDKARKLSPKADHIVYAVAALDCLTGEADAALANLKSRSIFVLPIVIMPATTKISRSCRKIPASRNFSIRKRTASASD